MRAHETEILFRKVNILEALWKLSTHHIVKGLGPH